MIAQGVECYRSLGVPPSKPGNFIFKMMNLTLTMMKFALTMMKFVLKMMNFALKVSLSLPFPGTANFNIK